MDLDLKKIKKWFLSKDLDNYKDDINRKNFIALNKFISLGILIYISNIVIQIICESVYSTISSVVMLFAFIVGFIVIRMLSGKKIPSHSTLSLYVFISLTLFLSLLNGTFFDTQHTAFSIFIYMIALILIILDKPWRLILFTSVWPPLIIIFSYLAKSPEIFKIDVAQTIMTYLITILAGSIVLGTRIVNVKNTYMLIHTDRTDDLTGMYNRKYFIAAAQDIVDNDKTGVEKTIAYYDISGTRNFNHDFGFSEGDRLLIRFGEILRSVYPDRLSARFGEDHFVVLLYGDEWKNTYANLTALLDSYIYSRFGNHIVNAADFSDDADLPDGSEIQINIKFGICNISDRNTTVTLACDRARIACHNLKPNEYYRIYDESLETEAKKEKYIIEHLDEAIKNDYIKVYYQPVVRSLTGELCGEEALSRWDDPEKGLLPPGDFIPVLENHMLLYRVDIYVLEQVLKDFRKKEEEGIELVPISINLSRNDFEGRDMVRIVTELVDKYGYSHNLIDVEITESAYTDSPERIKNVILGFHSAGFRVWMDDFGSGYSSLNMLQDCSFDLIKLDMLFMRNFGAKNEAIIKSVISMANRLGIDTLAEGVETEEQSRFLKKEGCDRQQGFLFDRPVPLDRVIKNYRITGCYKYLESSQYSKYYETISNVNMSDPFTCFNESDVSESIDSLPVCIIDSNFAL
ncbi:MAG: EAL domain-containing protein [Candidatus Weimeria sp.]